MILSHKDKIFKIFVYITWIFLFFVVIYDLFIVPYRSILWAGALFFLCFFYFKFKSIPPYVHMLLSLMVVSHVFGELFFEFYYVENCINPSYCINLFYDKILHFLAPLVVCAFVYFLAKPRIRDRKILILFSVTSAFSLLVVWEIFEYVLDYTFGTLMQGVFVIGQGQYVFANLMLVDIMLDTILDLVLDLAGCLVFWILMFYIRVRKN